LSLLPGKLFLESPGDGQHIVRVGDEILLSTKSQREAQKRYNKIRAEMEASFPSPELSQEDKVAAGRAAQLDAMAGHNSTRPEKKKLERGSTRTFG
jgi:hypothetical protein